MPTTNEAIINLDSKIGGNFDCFSTLFKDITPVVHYHSGPYNPIVDVSYQHPIVKQEIKPEPVKKKPRDCIAELSLAICQLPHKPSAYDDFIGIVSREVGRHAMSMGLDIYDIFKQMAETSIDSIHCKYGREEITIHELFNIPLKEWKAVTSIIERDPNSLEPIPLHPANTKSIVRTFMLCFLFLKNVPNLISNLGGRDPREVDKRIRTTLKQYYTMIEKCKDVYVCNPSI
jgi:hypothetical protein